jgi:hypothetical protein
MADFVVVLKSTLKLPFCSITRVYLDDDTIIALGIIWSDMNRSEKVA